MTSVKSRPVCSTSERILVQSGLQSCYTFLDSAFMKMPLLGRLRVIQISALVFAQILIINLAKSSCATAEHCAALTKFPPSGFQSSEHRKAETSSSLERNMV